MSSVSAAIWGEIAFFFFCLPPFAGRVRLPKLLSASFLWFPLMHQLTAKVYPQLSYTSTYRSIVPLASTKSPGDNSHSHHFKAWEIHPVCVLLANIVHHWDETSFFQTETLASRHAGQTYRPLSGSTGVEQQVLFSFTFSSDNFRPTLGSSPTSSRSSVKYGSILWLKLIELYWFFFF